ncbi:MAG: D-alanine--D-alanine ligase B [Verrucomicrobiae bacterium]|nr:D-alanine--D-alanine ligase B [Verrucomicrobiae bacterium]
MKHLHVAVLMGGPSAEAAVSRASGKMVLEALRGTGVAAEPVDLLGTTVELPAGVDLAFIAMHGAFGEDGHLQQILEDRGVPYTGSDAGASARAFDKVTAKECFQQAGIPTPAFAIGNLGEDLDLPVVVKPARQGSSVGISIVRERPELAPALARAQAFPGAVIVEEFVRGRELTVGILGTDALPVIEIRTKHKFFDFEAKYTAGEAEEICPAPLDAATTVRAQELAWRAHESLGCRDFSRVDLMLSETGELCVLEVNTIPGMTANSLLPKAARTAGLGMPALCLRMIEMALTRRPEAVAA